MMTNNARHALVWLLTVHSATRTSSRTHHRNPGLDIRAIFEEGRENAKFSWHVMARARVFEPRAGKVPEHAMTVCAMSAGGCVQQANGAFPVVVSTSQNDVRLGSEIHQLQTLVTPPSLL